MRKTIPSYLAIGVTLLALAGAAFAMYPKTSGSGLGKPAVRVTQAVEKHPLFNLDSDPAILEEYARQGDEFAQFSLGRAYYLGRGVPKDTEKALFLFEQSATQGYVPAQFLAARVHSQYPQSAHQELAIFWFKQAAHAGLIEAQIHLDELTLPSQKGEVRHVAASYR